MIYKYVIADHAKSDFENIKQYLTKEVSEAYSKKITKAILETIRKTCEMPKLYQIRPEPYYRKQKIRTMIVENFAIFYRVNDDKQRIEIARIRNQKQDNRWLKID